MLGQRPGTSFLIAAWHPEVGLERQVATRLCHARPRVVARTDGIAHHPPLECTAIEHGEALQSGEVLLVTSLATSLGLVQLVASSAFGSEDAQTANSA